MEFYNFQYGKIHSYTALSVEISKLLYDNNLTNIIMFLRK